MRCTKYLSIYVLSVYVYLQTEQQVGPVPNFCQGRVGKKSRTKINTEKKSTLREGRGDVGIEIPSLLDMPSKIMRGTQLKKI